MPWPDGGQVVGSVHQQRLKCLDVIKAAWRSLAEELHHFRLAAAIHGVVDDEQVALPGLVDIKAQPVGPEMIRLGGERLVDDEGAHSQIKAGNRPLGVFAAHQRTPVDQRQVGQAALPVEQNVFCAAIEFEQLAAPGKLRLHVTHEAAAVGDYRDQHHGKQHEKPHGLQNGFDQSQHALLAPRLFATPVGTPTILPSCGRIAAAETCRLADAQARGITVRSQRLH